MYNIKRKELVFIESEALVQIEETTEKAVHGGRRSGAGRPKLGVVRIFITLPADQVEWLKTRGKASEQIRGLISAKMEGEC